MKKESKNIKTFDTITKIAVSKRAFESLADYKSRSGKSKVNYSSLILSMLNDLATHDDEVSKLNSNIEVLESSIEREKSKSAKHIATMTSQLNKVNRVNKNLLDLFIVSVGGTPPGVEE